MAIPLLTLTSLDTTRNTFPNIPRDLKELLVCCICQRAAFDAEHPVVIPCAHILCMECLEIRWKRVPNKEEFSCPACTTSVKIPREGIEAFPEDSFSNVLKNSLLGGAFLPNHPPPWCGLHPTERLSHYCLKCQVQICERCQWRNHSPSQGHRLELLRPIAERMDAELTEFVRPTLTYVKKQICWTLENVRRERGRMEADIHQALHSQKKLKENAQKKQHYFQARLQEIQSKLKQTEQDIVTMLHSLQQDVALAAAQETMRHMQESVENGHKQVMQEIRALCKAQQTTAHKAQRNINKLQGELTKAKEKFLDAEATLETYKHSIDCNLLFARTLHHKGNDSDKVSRVPGIKDKMLQGKLYSGKKVALETIIWESCKSQGMSEPFSDVRLADRLVEPMGQDKELLLPALKPICTIPIKCKPAWGVKTVQLFDKHFVLHSFKGDNSDKICFHSITKGEGTHVVSVPQVKEFTGPVIVDSTAGIIAVADQVQVWSEEMMVGSSQTHLSGHLYWLTLSKSFTVTNYTRRQMQCVKLGHMGVNQDGHLLVLSHCTTGEHPRQLLMYDSSQDHNILYQVSLPREIERPLSAVNSAKDIFVVVDFKREGKLWWIDKDGQVLHQYGLQACEELLYPTHIIQHSKGPLLTTNWMKHRLALLSSDATWSLDLSDVSYPSTLHLDEHAGFLYVVQRKDQWNAEVKLFKFCVKTIRSLSVQVQA